MSTLLLAAVSGITRTWVRAYTSGLARDDRAARRTEVDSDLWEHRADASTEGADAARIAIATASRLVRGIPADVMWRFNMDGPKMELNIPFQRVAGALLILLVVLGFVTGAISGYDTGRENFGDEAARLADQPALAHNMNAMFRVLTGLALIATAAVLFTTLRERSPLLTTIAAFGLAAAGALGLAANAMQMVFVEMAEEYVVSSGTHQDSVLTTARAFALGVEVTSFSAIAAFMASVYTLAVLAGRERLVPRWLIGLPVISAALIAGAFIAGTGKSGDSLVWVFMMSGLLMGVTWLLIAGFTLLFSSQPLVATAQATPHPDPA
jgi:hypothetical protein